MSWLSEALHGAARALTVPHAERVAIQEQLSANPALLETVNTLKTSLTTSLVHLAVGSGADPLTAALESVAIAQAIERMIPTPATAPVAPELPAPASSPLGLMLAGISQIHTEPQPAASPVASPADAGVPIGHAVDQAAPAPAVGG